MSMIAGGKENKDKYKSITGRREFMDVPVYTGKFEEYENWRFKVRTYLADEPGIIDLILKLDMFAKEPNKNESDTMFIELVDNLKLKNIHTSWEYMNTQLYTLLSLKTTDRALVTVKNLYDQTFINGCLSWWKLGYEHTAMTSQKMQGLAGKVYSPKRVKKYSEVTAAIEEW